MDNLTPPPSSGPDKDEAQQFALMMQAGMPSRDALRYFYPDIEDAATLAKIHHRWITSPRVAAAIVALQGKNWQDMTLDERIQTSINLHYAQLAYLLYSRNYVELIGAEKQKADTARQALEAKLAGSAGKLGPIEAFWEDIRTGKVKLGVPTLAPAGPKKVLD